MHKKVTMDKGMRALFNVSKDSAVLDTEHTPMLICPALDWDEDGTYRHEVEDSAQKRSFYSVAAVSSAISLALFPPENLTSLALSFAVTFGMAAYVSHSLTKQKTHPDNAQLIYCTDSGQMVVVNRVYDKGNIPVEFNMKSSELCALDLTYGELGGVYKLGLYDTHSRFSTIVGGMVYHTERPSIAAKLNGTILDHNRDLDSTLVLNVETPLKRSFD